MEIFWRSITNHRRAVFAVLLFCTVFSLGTLLPAKASADTNYCWFFGPGGRDVCNLAINGGNAATSTAQLLQVVHAQLEDIYSLLSGMSTGNIFAFVLTKLTTIQAAIFYNIAVASGELFKYVINQLVSNPNLTITHEEVFLKAWDTMKNYANMLIVLALIASAAMIILRVWADKGKSMLLPILTTALLINFSIVFCGLMIDASNLLMRSILVNGEQEVSLINKVNVAWNAIVWPREEFASENLNEAVAYFSFNLYFNVLYVIIAIALFFFTCIMVQRYIALIILFILSPLAFALRVFPFPGASELFNKWWHSFIKYCFTGIAAAFFLTLSVEFLTNIAWPAGTSLTAELLTRLTINFAIVLGLLIAGLMMTIKAGGSFATAVISGAAAVGSAILGGTGKVAGAGLKVSGAETLGKNLQNRINSVRDSMNDRTTRLMEWANLAPKGTLEAQQKARTQTRLEPYEKNLEGITDPGRLAEIATTSRDARERAAATRILAKRNKLSKIKDKAQRDAAIQNALGFGVDASEFSKSQPKAARLNEKRVNELMESKHLSREAAQDAAENEAIGKLSSADIGNIDKEDLDMRFIEHTTAGKLSGAKSALDNDQLAKLAGHLEDIKKKINTEDAAAAAETDPAKAAEHTKKANEWLAKYRAIYLMTHGEKAGKHIDGINRLRRSRTSGGGSGGSGGGRRGGGGGSRTRRRRPGGGGGGSSTTTPFLETGASLPPSFRSNDYEFAGGEISGGRTADEGEDTSSILSRGGGATPTNRFGGYNAPSPTRNEFENNAFLESGNNIPPAFRSNDYEFTGGEITEDKGITGTTSQQPINPSNRPARGVNPGPNQPPRRNNF